ncbi:MAG TPA: shikimate kinase [Bacillota bacterium]|nr:shikimate kinase [Bacillota bacterium]HPE37943.1 shikimate kinase [Bacillota bacterium]
MSAIKVGIIGYPLGHSMSQYIHERIMEAAGISGRYEVMEISPKELPTYAPILLREFTGFNVTIPHKVALVPYMDELDARVQEYGALNTVCRRVGYNTDADGFLSLGMDFAGKKVLVTGAGGVSRMMTCEAAKAKGKVTVLARSLEKAAALQSELRGKGLSIDITDSVDDYGMAEIFLQGTPCGMWPNIHEAAPGIEAIDANTLVFDTIYNPKPTKLLLTAKKRGAKTLSGLSMLFYQALAAEKIWSPEADFADERMARLLPEIEKEMLRNYPMKIVLTGFMGAGKTEIGRMLAAELRVPFVDLDEEIVRVAGCPIREIFARDGEESFRRMESAVFLEVMKHKERAVVSLGGGAVMREENRKVLAASNARTVFLRAPIDVLWERIHGDEGRPMLQGGDDLSSTDAQYRHAEALYLSRIPLYEEIADVTADATRSPEDVLRNVMDALS